jgi:hypothetical protein
MHMLEERNSDNTIKKKKSRTRNRNSSPMVLDVQCVPAPLFF